jgi:hypothetical protein
VAIQPVAGLIVILKGRMLDYPREMNAVAAFAMEEKVLTFEAFAALPLTHPAELVAGRIVGPSSRWLKDFPTHAPGLIEAEVGRRLVCWRAVGASRAAFSGRSVAPNAAGRTGQ